MSKAERPRRSSSLGTNTLRTELSMMDMMNAMADCGTHGWMMIAGGALIYGVLGLAGAALVKYLFFTARIPSAA